MQFRAGHLTLYWTHYLHVLNTILPTHTIHILYILTEWCAKVVMAYAMIKKGTRTCHAKQWPSPKSDGKVMALKMMNGLQVTCLKIVKFLTVGMSLEATGQALHNTFLLGFNFSL